MSEVGDLSELDDIPGTTVLTAQRARMGYWMNKFCMSLMDPDNRAKFKANEVEYLAQWPMSDKQREAILRRDYNAAIAEGGNIYYLGKIIATDGKSFLEAAASMSGMSTGDYAAMMRSGGRSPMGLRSIKEGR